MSIRALLLPLPPTHLRTRVHGTDDVASFWEVGRCVAGDIAGAVGDIRPRYVLDFGCGCGRVLPFLQERWGDATFYATDIDQEAVVWVRDTYPDVSTNVNGEMPPLPYADAFFDLIYAVSVWTHLDEDRGRAWLAEMRRILKPGGILVASLHGERAASYHLGANVWAMIAQREFAYQETTMWADTYPDWYGIAWHTEGYVRRVWGEYLTVLRYLPGALNDNHDLVVLERV